MKIRLLVASCLAFCTLMTSLCGAGESVVSDARHTVTLRSNDGNLVSIKNTIVDSTENLVEGLMFGWLWVTPIMLEELKSYGVTVVKVEEVNREGFSLRIYVADIVSVNFDQLNERPSLLVDNECDRTVRDLERTVENLCRLQTGIFSFSVDKDRFPAHVNYSLIEGDVVTTPTLLNKPAGSFTTDLLDTFEIEGEEYAYLNSYPKDLFRSEISGAQPLINYYCLSLEPDFVADSRGQTDDELWILQSSGPDGDLDLTLDMVEEFKGTLANLQRQLLEPNLYDPANGISSDGDIFLAGQGKFSAPFLAQLYLQPFN